jgi:hypothetical protein
MQLIAHTTSFEITTGVVIFLAGVCAGPWLAHFIYSMIKAPRS